MVLENLDRTQLSFAAALDHVETVVVAHRAAAASRCRPHRRATLRGPAETRKTNGKQRPAKNSWSRCGTATFMHRAATQRNAF